MGNDPTTKDARGVDDWVVLKAKADVLRDSALTLAVQHGRWVHSFVDEALIPHRDSVIYRAWSTRWHLTLLKRHLEAAHDMEHKAIIETVRNSKFVDDTRFVVGWLFDDVLFNLASLMDYLGCFVGYVYLGKKGQNLKWNGVVRAIRDPKHRLSRSGASETVLDHHRRWVDKFLGFRSGVIHRNIRLSPGRQSVRLGPAIEMEIHFEVPVELTKKLPFLVDKGLVQGGLLLVSRGFDATIEILEKVEAELRAYERVGPEAFRRGASNSEG